jgi:hypothetical protein
MNEKLLTVAADVAEHRFEIEVAGWGDSAHVVAALPEDILRRCLSCGAYQSLDGSLPCGH